VEHAAYGPWAAHLSDQGILVVVVSLEPMRLATLHHGARAQDILPILYHVASHHVNTVTVNEWSLGGHSAGGSCAFDLVQVLNMKKLVLYASHSPTDKRTHLLNDDGSSRAYAVKVLCVDATNDGILGRESPARLSHFKTKMVPPDTVFYTIQGGNHSGFAHFGPQTYPRMDGVRSIPLLEQQRQCVKVTASFLLVDDTGNMDRERTSVRTMAAKSIALDESAAEAVLERVLSGQLDPDDDDFDIPTMGVEVNNNDGDNGDDRETEDWSNATKKKTE
jgi:hypothetical protein